MDNSNNLTILIPTFKRPGKLRNLVKNIVLPVAKKYKRKVEFFIRDNTGINDIKNPLDQDLELPDNVNYAVNQRNLEYHGNIKTLLKLANNKYIWFWGDDDFYDLKEVLKVIKVVLDNKKNYEAFLPCFSYLSEKGFKSNIILGSQNDEIKLNELFRKNRDPFSLLSSLIFLNKNLAIRKNELSNAWLHAIIFLRSLSPDSRLWIGHNPCIYYEAIASGNEELEQRGITLKYYVESALQIMKYQEKYGGIKPPSKSTFHKEVVLWMIQHKGRLIYWSFTNKDMLTYGIKGILISILNFDIKLFLLSIILLLFPRKLIRITYRIQKWLKRNDYSYQRFFKTINI